MKKFNFLGSLFAVMLLLLVGAPKVGFTTHFDQNAQYGTNDFADPGDLEIFATSVSADCLIYKDGFVQRHFRESVQSDTGVLPQCRKQLSDYYYTNYSWLDRISRLCDISPYIENSFTTFSLVNSAWKTSFVPSGRVQYHFLC